MSRTRRNFTGAEKAAILREHLIERVPISDVCEKRGLQPTLFYQWQKRLFEEAATVLERSRRVRPARRPTDAPRMDALESKLRDRNELLAELLGEYVALKRALDGNGPPSGLAPKR